MVLTDPPYNCRFENNVSGQGRVKHHDFVMGAGELSDREFAATILRPALRNMAAHAAPGAIALCFIDWRRSPYLIDAAAGVFEKALNMIVWSRPTPAWAASIGASTS